MRDQAKVKNDLLILLDGNGANVSAACEAVQISRQTFYVWLSDDEEFAGNVHSVREKVLDNIETAMYKEAIGGNVTAAALILNARGKHRGYGQNQYRDEIPGAGGRGQVLVIEVPDNPLLRGEEVNYETLPAEYLPEKTDSNE